QPRLGRAQLLQDLALLDLEFLRAAAFFRSLLANALELLLLLVLVGGFLGVRTRDKARAHRREQEHERQQKAHAQCFRVSGTSATTAPSRPSSIAPATKITDQERGSGR